MERVSVGLRARLGEEAARDLEEYTEAQGDHWRERVMLTATERFDGRLATAAADLRMEMAGLRLDMSGFRSDGQTEMAGLRLEIAGFRLDVQREIQQGLKETHQGFASLWQAMADLRVSLRQDLADTRSELIRWSFLFWIGQVAVVAGLLAFMLRGVASK